VSAHDSTVSPLSWLADSAWIVPYASRVPGGGPLLWLGLGLTLGVGLGEPVPQPP
jgi:hypothetical protein